MIPAPGDGSAQAFHAALATPCPDRIVMAAQAMRAGMTVAHAQALVPDLAIAEARPGADEQALTELALWCLRYAPVVAPDPPDGVLIDIAGAAHLHAGGEATLLADLVERCSRAGYAARATVADTPGAAWAAAAGRHSTSSSGSIPT